MWERWPYQRIGERAYMRGTYDRSGGNEAADASHFLYELAPDYNVTLDVAGAGILYFVRTNRWHGSPWHYTVDGTDRRVTESNTADPLHPIDNAVFQPERIFPAPLALTESQTAGADLSWVPIGFQRSMRLADSRTFYGTGYYIYHQYVPGAKLSRPIASWDGKTPPDPSIGELLERAGTDIAPSAGALLDTGPTTLHDIRWQVRTMRYPDPPNHVGYFHATYHDQGGSLVPGQDTVLLDTAHTDGLPAASSWRSAMSAAKHGITTGRRARLPHTH